MNVTIEVLDVILFQFVVTGTFSIEKKGSVF